MKSVSPLLQNLFSLFAARSVPDTEVGSQLASLRRELEATRYHLQATIAAHNRAAREMNDILAALGNDLRNPLAALSYGVQLLRHDGNGASVKQLDRHLDRMDRQIRKLARLAYNLPDTAHIEVASTQAVKLRSVR